MSFLMGWLTGLGVFFLSVWAALVLSSSPGKPSAAPVQRRPVPPVSVLPEIPHRVFYLSGQEQFFLQAWDGTGPDNTAFYHKKDGITVLMGTCRMDAVSVRQVNMWESWTWTDPQGGGYRTWWWPQARRLSVLGPGGRVFWADLETPGEQGLPAGFWKDLVRRWQPGSAREDIHTPLRQAVLSRLEKI